jgi:tetratricopeptide (TPR) repeat protein
MELTLTRQGGTQVLVTCDSEPSHPFDMLTLVPGEQGPPQPVDDPVAYGRAVYLALFPPASAARRELEAMPDRILLVSTDDDIDSIPWEYAYGQYGTEDVETFLVLACYVVRGLPRDQRIEPPKMDEGLRIVAIPSNPLEQYLPPLDIDAEWMRLKEIIHDVPSNISLERARPPTSAQVRRLVANQRNRVVHFMGHGGQHETGALLCFEKENGELHPVTAREFVLRVRGSVFLVTLNACVSATPGPTIFSNLAAALVRQKTPYALGMRLSIHDDDARAFSRSFYSELASGVSVEDALFQARLTLANSPRFWVIGVPVLYTALTAPATGFTVLEGTPGVNEHQPGIEASALPRAQGAFQGRIDELKQLGDLLTGDRRPRLVTIHGSGGQGKTALAREAVERFAYAWPGGVWAMTLENLPGREVFVSDLARFLGISIQELHDPAEIEREVLSQLNQRRTLIVLDNAETLVEAVKANTESAIGLVRFLREHLSSPLVSLLITSREFLGWDGEVGLKRDLEGLMPEEGARLFRQAAPQRVSDAELALAAELSHKVDGHPLSLRLLGGAFNESAVSLPAFIKDCEAHLLQAENIYVGVEHRHRTLYACIDTSVRYLDDELTDLLSKLWLFHAPFLPETAVEIFDPTHDDTKDETSPVYDRLYTLWRRGLLVREEGTIREGTIQFYRVLPTIRPYIESYLARAEEREPLLTRFGAAYAQLVENLHRELNRGGVAAFIAFQSREDLERGLSYVMGLERGYYLLDWGWVMKHLGNPRRGLALAEQALEIGQSQDRQLELQALNNMALVYDATGQPQRALELFEQVLPIDREVGDRAGEAATLNNMGEVYRMTGQPQRALELYELALSLMREVGNRAWEATTLNNMAAVYLTTGKPQEALTLFEQALPIHREVGNRAIEAYTLNNMAAVYLTTGKPQEALTLFEQALPITQEVGDRAMEATTLANIAFVLYQYLNRSQEAITTMERAIAVFVETGLPQDAAGQTRDQLLHYLDAMHQGLSPDQANSGPAMMPSDQLQVLVSNTTAAMTTMQERRAEWREAIVNELQNAQQHGTDWHIKVEFFTAVLAILDGNAAVLPGDHPYAPALTQIQEGIAAAGLTDDDTPQDEELPFDPELVPRSISALLGGPQEKMAQGQYLSTMSAQTTDDELKALLQVIQLGLFSSDLSQLGENLSGVYRQAWETIVVGGESGGVDPRLFEMIIQNTLAVLGPAEDQFDKWRESLTQFGKQANEGDARELVALVDAVIGLLDAGGNPAGLGTSLTGVYARTWQAIVEQLSLS